MNDSTLKGGAAEAAAKGYIGNNAGGRISGYGGGPGSGGAGSAIGIGGNVYLVQQEAAAYLRLSPRTLERHRVAGTGPRFTKLGRRVVYALAELDAWATARTFQSTSEADAAAESGAAT